ncbi:MAG: methyltransferase domain-containing protein [Boseongicola sp.]
MTDKPRLTDRSALELHRSRARRMLEDFVYREAAIDLEERVSEVNKSFTSPAIIGGLVEPFRAIWPYANCVADAPEIALETASHDLIFHAMALHWADDPVGQLVQARLALKPDGLFIAVQFGGQTLRELRAVLAEAESRVMGGISPRVVPMAEIRELGALLQRAGFSQPVADSRTLTVRYPSFNRLVRDLRGMGETNALANRHRATSSRQLFEEAETIYCENYADTDGFLVATFELVYLTGWAPHESQQKPLKPGSAKARLADALRVDERPAGDPVTR